MRGVIQVTKSNVSERQASRLDVEGCRDAVVAFHEAIDRGEATKASAYLAEDPIIQMAGQRRNGVAMAEFLSQREAQIDRHTAHIPLHMPVIASTEGSVTLGGRLMIVSRNTAGTYDIEHVLAVTHRLEKSTGVWLIAERTASPIHP